jgi:hypothetical protein
VIFYGSTPSFLIPVSLSKLLILSFTLVPYNVAPHRSHSSLSWFISRLPLFFPRYVWQIYSYNFIHIISILHNSIYTYRDMYVDYYKNNNIDGVYKPTYHWGHHLCIIPSCQLAQVQTVQDLADLIWRTPRGLKLRTVDDETYIACLGAGRWLFSHLLSGNLSHSYWE